jgi:hypothetical protein
MNAVHFKLREKTMKKFVVAAAAALLAGQAFATPITGTSASGPVVPGATATIGFEDQPIATFSSVTIGDVKFSGVGGSLRTTSTFVGGFNTKGTRLLDNNAGGTSGFRFDFTNPLSAFAFNFGASDNDWTLSAYSSSGALLESLTLARILGSNSGNYYGLADAGISYALLTSAIPNDYVLLDNFTIAEQPAAANVPEPASLALLGAGLAGVLATRRRKATRTA